jgi:hypothetical protein
MSIQRYVSKELTHFVGKGKSEEEQYSILVESILKSGVLKTFPGQQEDYVVLEKGNVVGSGSPYKPVEEAYQPQVVCFCDIPVEDLEIHMRKYGTFGLSFLKPFLIEKGANPVLYVANNSGSLNFAPGETLRERYGESPIPRRDLFEESIRAYQIFIDKMRFGRSEVPSDSEAFNTLHVWDTFLQNYVFCFIKFFDDTKPDEDPENVYMEREWRVLGNVPFKLEDVYRVFLPPSYAKRFREDLPDYAGQVTFVGS